MQKELLTGLSILLVGSGVAWSQNCGKRAQLGNCAQKTNCAKTASCAKKASMAGCVGTICMAKMAKVAEAQKMMNEAAIINTTALEALLGSGEKVVVLDARSGKWDDGRRLPGAASLSDKATAEEAAALIGSKKQLVVTYCSNLKCPASKRLAMHLKKLGYENVMQYPQGIDGWTAAGKSVKQTR